CGHAPSAVAEGAELLELDVRRSRDGVVVVSHDRHLWRQSGRHLDIAQTNYEV
ncbi:GDPD3 Lysophospholipase, partial [Pomatostomus ruficeps]|nr:GDPD3 Lysophospholipase [Pomatostomus ruficeps]